jgi:hypothetical protein
MRFSDVAASSCKPNDKGLKNIFLLLRENPDFIIGHALFFTNTVHPQKYKPLKLLK